MASLFFRRSNCVKTQHKSWRLCMSKRSFSTKFMIDPKLYSKPAFEARTGRSFGPLNLYEDIAGATMSATTVAPLDAAATIIERDSNQIKSLQQLDAIFRRNYDSAAGDASSCSTRGLYIHGPVGSGKSMCMDLFHYCCEEMTRHLPLSSERDSADIQSRRAPQAKREHFHEFMYRVHRGLHRLQKEAHLHEATADERSRGFEVSINEQGIHTAQNRILQRVEQSETKRSTFDNLKIIAQETRRDGADILCFDEFSITTIQDCVVLTPLFIHLFAEGVVVVMTSNRHPEDLYEGGLNRHQHLPRFLEMLYLNMDLMHVKTKDYRLAAFNEEVGAEAPIESGGYGGDAILANGSAWPIVQPPEMLEPSFRHRMYFGRDETDRAAAKALLASQGVQFEALYDPLNGGSHVHATKSGGGSQKTNLTEVEIGYGRSLMVETSLHGDGRAARFSIDTLIRRPHSADDYNAICRRFHTIVVDGLWVLKVEDHNEAKRMTNFLDTAYEHHVQLILTGMEQTQPEAIFEELNLMEGLVQEEMINERDEDVKIPAMDPTTISEHSVQVRLSTHPKSFPLKSSPLDNPTRADAIQRLETMQGGVQSCLFYSADHKNWSVESKFVQQMDGKRRQSTAAASVEGKGEDQGEDPTSEQQSVKGVFVAAVASLNETSFAAKRSISRLNEMQTKKYIRAHRQIHGLDQ